MLRTDDAWSSRAEAIERGALLAAANESAGPDDDREDVGYRGYMGQPVKQYVGGPAVFPSDPAGRPAALCGPAPTFVGARTAGVRAWSEKGRLVAVGVAQSERARQLP
jgi:hypothetical protein